MIKRIFKIVIVCAILLTAGFFAYSNLFDIPMIESNGRVMRELKILIAIDPGHGGPEENDKGYTTLDGTHECVMNNAVALMLENILIKRGYDVVFTKEPKDDVYASLQSRPEAANAAAADLLISIHHDANGDQDLSGFWLFYSSYKINLDTEDLVVLYDGKEYDLVSERNELDEDGDSYTIKLITDGEETFEINSIEHRYKIIDRTPCEEAIASEDLAYCIYDEMLKLDYIEPKGSIDYTIIDEEYRVLRYADMPSVLIEAGFMTNPTQMSDIQDSENQLKLATAIADGVDRYFQNKF